MLPTSSFGGGSITAADLLPNAIKHGWRSGLEKSLAAYLDERNISYEYEEHKVKYTVPERQATYTPDFYVTTRSGKLIIIETKGRFVTADRQKMLLVKEQHPDLDIRFVFLRANNKIYKGSKTTYADWATKHKFEWAEGSIPEEWCKNGR